MPIERYIGGGKIYFTPYSNGTYGTEVEIGEVQDAKLSVNNTYVNAFSKDSGMAKKVDKVLTQTDAKISFTTQNVSKENMAMAMFGELKTETFTTGAELPDGTTATQETTIPVIEGGVIPKVEGKIKIVGANIAGAENPVLEVPLAVLTPAGDLRDYFNTSDFTSLGFDGEVLESNGLYFKEYYIPKA